ncbi:MAG: hypothetical protein ACRCV3_03405 [Desulfovibrionaceae bacterium]
MPELNGLPPVSETNTTNATPIETTISRVTQVHSTSPVPPERVSPTIFQPEYLPQTTSLQEYTTTQMSQEAREFLSILEATLLSLNKLTDSEESRQRFNEITSSLEIILSSLPQIRYREPNISIPLSATIQTITDRITSSLNHRNMAALSSSIALLKSLSEEFNLTVSSSSFTAFERRKGRISAVESSGVPGHFILPEGYSPTETTEAAINLLNTLPHNAISEALVVPYSRALEQQPRELRYQFMREVELLTQAFTPLHAISNHVRRAYKDITLVSTEIDQNKLLRQHVQHLITNHFPHGIDSASLLLRGSLNSFDYTQPTLQELYNIMVSRTKFLSAKEILHFLTAADSSSQEGGNIRVQVIKYFGIFPIFLRHALNPHSHIYQDLLILCDLLETKDYVNAAKHAMNLRSQENISSEERNLISTIFYLMFPVEHLPEESQAMTALLTALRDNVFSSTEISVLQEDSLALLPLRMLHHHTNSQLDSNPGERRLTELSHFISELLDSASSLTPHELLSTMLPTITAELNTLLLSIIDGLSSPQQGAVQTLDQLRYSLYQQFQNVLSQFPEEFSQLFIPSSREVVAVNHPNYIRNMHATLSAIFEHTKNAETHGIYLPTSGQSLFSSELCKIVLSSSSYPRNLWISKETFTQLRESYDLFCNTLESMEQTPLSQKEGLYSDLSALYNATIQRVQNILESRGVSSDDIIHVQDQEDDIPAESSSTEFSLDTQGNQVLSSAGEGHLPSTSISNVLSGAGAGGDDDNNGFPNLQINSTYNNAIRQSSYAHLYRILYEMFGHLLYGQQARDLYSELIDLENGSIRHTIEELQQQINGLYNTMLIYDQRHLTHSESVSHMSVITSISKILPEDLALQRRITTTSKDVNTVFRDIEEGRDPSVPLDTLTLSIRSLLQDIFTSLEEADNGKRRHIFQHLVQYIQSENSNADRLGIVLNDSLLENIRNIISSSSAYSGSMEELRDSFSRAYQITQSIQTFYRNQNHHIRSLRNQFEALQLISYSVSSDFTDRIRRLHDALLEREAAYPAIITNSRRILDKMDIESTESERQTLLTFVTDLEGRFNEFSTVHPTLRRIFSSMRARIQNPSPILQSDLTYYSDQMTMYSNIFSSLERINNVYLSTAAPSLEDRDFINSPVNSHSRLSGTIDSELPREEESTEFILNRFDTSFAQRYGIVPTYLLAIHTERRSRLKRLLEAIISHTEKDSLSEEEHTLLREMQETLSTTALLPHIISYAHYKNMLSTVEQALAPIAQKMNTSVNPTPLVNQEISLATSAESAFVISLHQEYVFRFKLIESQRDLPQDLFLAILKLRYLLSHLSEGMQHINLQLNSEEFLLFSSLLQEINELLSRIESALSTEKSPTPTSLFSHRDDEIIAILGSQPTSTLRTPQASPVTTPDIIVNIIDEEGLHSPSSMQPSPPARKRPVRVRLYALLENIEQRGRFLKMFADVMSSIISEENRQIAREYYTLCLDIGVQSTDITDDSEDLEDRLNGIQDRVVQHSVKIDQHLSLLLTFLSQENIPSIMTPAVDWRIYLTNTEHQRLQDELNSINTTSSQSIGKSLDDTLLWQELLSLEDILSARRDANDAPPVLLLFLNLIHTIRGLDLENRSTIYPNASVRAILYYTARTLSFFQNVQTSTPPSTPTPENVVEPSTFLDQIERVLSLLRLHYHLNPSDTEKEKNINDRRTLEQIKNALGTLLNAEKTSEASQLVEENINSISNMQVEAEEALRTHLDHGGHLTARSRLFDFTLRPEQIGNLYTLSNSLPDSIQPEDIETHLQFLNPIHSILSHLRPAPRVEDALLSFISTLEGLYSGIQARLRKEIFSRGSLLAVQHMLFLLHNNLYPSTITVSPTNIPIFTPTSIMAEQHSTVASLRPLFTEMRQIMTALSRVIGENTALENELLIIENALVILEGETLTPEDSKFVNKTLQNFVRHYELLRALHYLYFNDLPLSGQEKTTIMDKASIRNTSDMLSHLDNLHETASTLLNTARKANSNTSQQFVALLENTQHLQTTLRNGTIALENAFPLLESLITQLTFITEILFGHTHTASPATPLPTIVEEQERPEQREFAELLQTALIVYPSHTFELSILLHQVNTIDENSPDAQQELTLIRRDYEKMIHLLSHPNPTRQCSLNAFQEYKNKIALLIEQTSNMEQQDLNDSVYQNTTLQMLCDHLTYSFDEQSLAMSAINNLSILEISLSALQRRSFSQRETSLSRQEIVQAIESTPSTSLNISVFRKRLAVVALLLEHSSRKEDISAPNTLLSSLFISLQTLLASLNEQTCTIFAPMLTSLEAQTIRLLQKPPFAESSRRSDEPTPLSRNDAALLNQAVLLISLYDFLHSETQSKISQTNEEQLLTQNIRFLQTHCQGLQISSSILSDISQTRSLLLTISENTHKGESNKNVLEQEVSKLKSTINGMRTASSAVSSHLLDNEDLITELYTQYCQNSSSELFILILSLIIQTYRIITSPDAAPAVRRKGP